VRLGEPRAAAEKAESSDFFALWAEFGAQFAANAPRDAGAVRGASRRPSGTKGAIRSGKGRVVEPRLGPCAPAVARPSKAGAGSRSDVISEAARAVGVRMRARTPLSRQAERRWHSLPTRSDLGQVAAGKGGREQIETFIHTEEAKDALCERLAQRPDTKAPPPPCALHQRECERTEHSLLSIADSAGEEGDKPGRARAALRQCDRAGASPLRCMCDQQPRVLGVSSERWHATRRLWLSRADRWLSIQQDCGR
jgi:hypothetical protein